MAILTMSGALLGGGAFAGCGGDEDTGGGVGKAPAAPKVAKPADPSDAITGAAERTAKAQSYRIDVKTGAEIGGQSISGTFDGGADLKAKKATAKIDFSGFAKAAGSQVDALGGADALKGELVTDASGGGLKAYIKLPALNKGFSQLGSSDLKPWGKVDLGSLGKIGGVDISSLLSVSQSAEQTTALLRALAGDPKEVGSEQIDGQPTTHYRATVDYAKPAPDASPEVRKVLDQTAKLLQTSGAPTSMPLDVWIGEDGYVHREQFAQSVPGEDGKITSTIDFSDFGAPVTVQIPPADQTWDVLAEIKARFPSALAGLQSGAPDQASATTTGVG